MHRLNPAAFLPRLLLPGRPTRHRQLQIWVAAASCLYLLSSLAVWAILRLAAERWWFATLVLFGPRWIFALPLPVILLAALLANRRAIGIIGVATVILLPALMNFAVPWRPLLSGRGSGAHLRLLTCNIHGHRTVTSELARLIDTANPDVVVFQEWTSQDEPALSDARQWYTQRNNELFIASRFPIEAADDIALGRWGPAGAVVCYRLNFNGNTVPVICMHLASPHYQFEDAIYGSPDAPDEINANSAMRAEQSLICANYAKALGASTILAGDFNTPPDSPIFQHAWIGFTDAFTVAGWGFGNTYFTRWSSTRIDHIVAAGAWRCQACWVGPNVGSPHRPLVADLEWDELAESNKQIH